MQSEFCKDINLNPVNYRIKGDVRVRCAGIHWQGRRGGKYWKLTSQYLKGIRLIRNMNGEEPAVRGSYGIRDVELLTVPLMGAKPPAAFVLGSPGSLRGLPLTGVGALERGGCGS
jgi:hypothetical protein